ncbi:MAG: HDOD domain-containing protein [Candidatus Sulfotelmatobacter sp.]
MTAAPSAKQVLLQRLEGLHQIPTIPAVLAPLLHYLQQPMEKLDVQKVTDLISQDKSLAAQCLQMANSPLFGRSQNVQSLRAAVVSLGFHHVSDIAMSCGVLSLLPTGVNSLDPVVFWEHSLGCALVSRHIARKINFSDPGKAYLAGLLHDLGIIVNLWVLPREFRTAWEMGRAEGIPLHEAEQKAMGFTHCESGRLLAERWQLAPELIEVVSCHHSPEKSTDHAGLVALVQLADLLCRMRGLNYGYVEERQVNLAEESGFGLLGQHSTKLKDFDWARLTFELDSYMDEVHSLVRAIYRT